jgi:hypothetical protein
MSRNIETFHIEWNGIAIEIRYEPHWLGMDIGFDTAHLEIESMAPEHAHLPITERLERALISLTRFCHNATPR